jgi:hypothetical protein
MIVCREDLSFLDDDEDDLVDEDCEYTACTRIGFINTKKTIILTKIPDLVKPYIMISISNSWHTCLHSF